MTSNTAELGTAMWAVGALLLSGVSCTRSDFDLEWLNALHDEARSLFFQTVRATIGAHPERELLTDVEREKITGAEQSHPRLPDILLNVYYQKDEPFYQELFETGGRRGKSRFRDEYLDLARFAAEQFVACFFTTDEATDYMRRSYPPYAELDAFDLVLRAIGYDARLEIPERELYANELSPEFDRQGGLDGGRFREAHEVTKGAGVKIAILDTGIDTLHAFFRDKQLGPHFSLVGKTGPPWTEPAPVIDWGFHGTAIASVAARYAPEAEITMYKFGDGELQNDPAYQLLTQAILAAAIYRAVHDGNHIISLSAAGSTLDSDYLREAVRYAYEQNRIVISGSAYQRWAGLGFTRNFPGQYPTVVSVTAAERKEDGSYGYWDVCARDSATTVAAPSDVFAAMPTYMEEVDMYIPSISAAIPTVASLFALVASVYPPFGTEAPGEYAQTLIDLVTETANPEAVGQEGFSAESGHGLIDAARAVQRAGELQRGTPQ